jgi:hypothetical protein
VAEITVGGGAWKLHGVDIPRPEICLASHHDANLTVAAA